MNFKKCTISLILIFAVLLITNMSFAQRGFGPPPDDGFGWWRDPAIAEQLNLTDSQQEQIDELIFNFELEHVDLQANVERQRIIFFNMLNQDDIDLDEMEELVDALIQAEGQVMKQRIMVRVTIMSLLTPEQRDILITLGRGPGRGGPPMQRPNQMPPSPNSNQMPRQQPR